MKKEPEYCPCCGLRIPTEYKHGLTKVLIKGLVDLYNTPNKQANLNQLIQNKTEYTNFQKLRYFGLAIPLRKEDNGEWVVTNKGRWFLRGQIPCERFVWTRAARVVRMSAETLFITEVKDCVQFKQDWQKQASHQLTLFEGN